MTRNRGQLLGSGEHGCGREDLSRVRRITIRWKLDLILLNSAKSHFFDTSSWGVNFCGRHSNLEASLAARPRWLGKKSTTIVQTSFSALHEPPQQSCIWICISFGTANVFRVLPYLKKASPRPRVTSRAALPRRCERGLDRLHVKDRQKSEFDGFLDCIIIESLHNPIADA